MISHEKKYSFLQTGRMWDNRFVLLGVNVLSKHFAKFPFQIKERKESHRDSNNKTWKVCMISLMWVKIIFKSGHNEADLFFFFFF